jgi:hypothetical protein
MATRQFYVFDVRQRAISTRGDFSPDPYIVARAGAAAGFAVGYAVPQSIGMGYMVGSAAGIGAGSGVSQALVNGFARAAGSAAGFATLQAYGLSGIFRTGAGAAAGSAGVAAVGRPLSVAAGAGSVTGAGAGVTAVATAPDPLRAQVALLVPADGTDGATSVADRSIYGRTLVGSGTASQSTARRRTGAASLFFGDTPGAGGRFTLFSNAVVPAEFGIAGADMTLEFSYYAPETSGAALSQLFTLGRHTIDGTTGATALHGFGMEWDANGALRARFSNGTTTTVLEAATIAPVNRFCVVAVSKVGANLYLHINGALTSQATLPGGGLTLPALADCTIGAASRYDSTTGAVSGAVTCYGNVDDLRLTVGTSRYGAANYAPSPDPFPAY